MGPLTQNHAGPGASVARRPVSERPAAKGRSFGRARPPGSQVPKPLAKPKTAGFSLPKLRESELTKTPLVIQAPCESSTQETNYRLRKRSSSFRLPVDLSLESNSKGCPDLLGNPRKDSTHYKPLALFFFPLDRPSA